MKSSWGTLRVCIVVALSVAAFAMVGLHRSSGRAYGGGALAPTLFVTNSCSNAVTAYSAASNGDVGPKVPPAS